MLLFAPLESKKGKEELKQEFACFPGLLLGQDGYTLPTACSLGTR